MSMRTKWSALIMGTAFVAVVSLPAVPAFAASHWGHEHVHHGLKESREGRGQHGGRNWGNQGNKNHGKMKNKNKHQPQDRLKVIASRGHVTAPQAALLAGVTLSLGTASTVFAQGTPYTVYTVRLVGPHAHFSGTGSVTVSDNDGSLSTPADLYYLGFQRGYAHPDPFFGDTTPYNATTVGQSSTFSVAFVRGQAQFAVFNGHAGSGPVQITVTDAALNQTRTVTYPDKTSSSTTSTATQELIEYQGAVIPSTGLTLTADSPIALTVVNANASGTAVPVTGTALTVDVSTTAPDAELLGQIGGSPITSVQIPVGFSSATFYLESTIAQTVLPSEIVASVPQVAAQNIVATETATGASVTWTAPSTGNPASYQVWEINTTTGVKSDIDASLSGSATSYAVTGLVPGDSYAFNIDAVNAYGTVTLGQPSTAIEYGTAAVGVTPGAFIDNTATTAGSVEFTVTMDKSLPSQTPTLANFTVKDTTANVTYQVTSVTVSGNLVGIVATIPAGTVVAATDTVNITASQGALTDSVGAPSAAMNLTTTN